MDINEYIVENTSKMESRCLIDEGEATRFFNGKENERIPGKRNEERYDTDDRKLEFLQRYGWLIDDPEVRAYSAKFKSKKK